MLLPYNEFNRLFKLTQDRINEEIKINPEYIYYTLSSTISPVYYDKYDYVCNFDINGVPYVLILMYYPINDVETYHIIFTTFDQYSIYLRNFIKIKQKGYVTDDEFKQLNDIIGKETNLNDFYKVFKKISWMVFDVHEKYIPDYKLSLVVTDNPKKIKIYRNIIKNSFENVTETKVELEDNDYFIYEIK